jgi:hypothetical protein
MAAHADPRLPRRFATVALASLLATLIPGGAALATNVSDFSVTPATGGSSISASTASAEWTALTGPVINVVPYSNPDVIPTGTTFTLQLPANFEWNDAITAAPTVTVAPGAPAGFCTLVPSGLTYFGTGNTASSLSFTLSGSHDVACLISFSTLQVRPISGNSSAGTGGDIAVSWNIPGVGQGSAKGGVLTMVPVVPVVITPATGGTDIPSSTAGGAWTTLTGPTITEGTSGQLSSAKIVLALPANFMFNANVTAAPAATCGYPISGITYFGTGNQATSAQVTVSGHATMTKCAVQFGKILQVRPISADPAAGTGGNIAVSIDGVASGSGGAISMATPPPGTLTLTITSPTMNNNAIIWGQSYIDIKTTGSPGTSFQIQASTDNATWTPLKNSSGAVLTWTIGSSGFSTYRYTPIRNYWYKSVAGSSVSNTWRITVRQTCAISPSHSGTTTVGAGSKITFTTTSRPARSDLPTANVIFQLYQKSSSGSWVLNSSITKAINAEGQISWPVTFSTKGSFYVRAQTQPTSVNSNSFWTPNQYYDVN